VTLTASADTAYHFTSWGGDTATATTLCRGHDATAADRHFVINSYTLAVSTVAAAACQGPDQLTYNYGTPVTLRRRRRRVAIHELDGDTTTATNPLSLVMTRSRSLTATFAINTYTSSRPPWATHPDQEPEPVDLQLRDRRSGHATAARATTSRSGAATLAVHQIQSTSRWTLTRSSSRTQCGWAGVRLPAISSPSSSTADWISPWAWPSCPMAFLVIEKSRRDPLIVQGGLGATDPCVSWTASQT